MSDFEAGPVNVAMLSRQELPQLQAFLLAMGYPPGPNDGLWGPKTKAAWEKFATDNGLPTGTVDGSLWQVVAGEGDRSGFTQGPGGETSILEQFGAENVAGDGVLSEEELDQIRTDYPTLAHLLDEPVIGDLLREAVEFGWDATKLVSKMEATEWWQTTSANQRQFDADVARDPASLDQDIQNQQILLEGILGSYGITLDPDEVAQMSRDIVRNGTSESGVLRLVGDKARSLMGGGSTDPGGDAQGQLGAIVQQLQSMSRSYHLGHSTDQLEEWAIRIVEGRWTFDAAEATVRRQASLAYPHLADEIAQGTTVEDFFAPTRNRLAQVLDMNPNDIDLTSDRWADVTQTVDDNGNVRAMTYSEIGQFARKQNEYLSTDAANASGYSVLNSVLDTMGVQ